MTGDKGEEVGFVHIEGGSDETFELVVHWGWARTGGDDVDEIEGGGGEEESFEFFEAAFDDEKVNEEGGEGDGEEFVDMEDSKAAAMPANSAAMVPMLAMKRMIMMIVVQRSPNFSRMREARPLPVTSPMRAPILG